MNNLKQWVNNNDFTEAFNEHLDGLIIFQHKIMEQASEPAIFYRAQGAITQLRKLKLLRETVNGAES
jgi:hypothetical protein